MSVPPSTLELAITEPSDSTVAARAPESQHVPTASASGRQTITPSTAPPTRPIRVAYVIDNLGVGGTEQWLLRLIRGFDRSQVEPHLILLDGSDPSSRNLEPADVSTLRLGLKSFRSPFLLVNAAHKYLRYLRRHQIDAVQLHFTNSTLFAAPLTKMSRIRHVWATSRNSGYWMSEGSQRLHRWSRRFVTATIANSEASSTFAIDGLGVAPGTVVVIPNGVDFRRFSSIATLRKHATSEDPWRVGIVSNLRPIKDLPTFVSAARLVLREIPTAQFLIAGDGPDRCSLSKLIQETGLTEHVQVLGEVRDIPEFLDRLDVVALSSQSEGLSNSLLEYMAAGRPIVATDVGGNVDLVKAGVTGLLCPPGKPDAMASGILQLLLDRDFANRLGSSARRLALARFSLDTETKAYTEFYRSQVRAAAGG